MSDEHTITVKRFHQGEAVPSWLLDVEPVALGARKEKLDFTQPTDVIELTDYFVILPVTSGNQPSLLDFRGEGCRLVAPNKLVRGAVSQMIVVPDAMLPEYGLQAAAPPAVPLTFWQRVVAVFAPKRIDPRYARPRSRPF